MRRAIAAFSVWTSTAIRPPENASEPFMRNSADSSARKQQRLTSKFVSSFFVSDAKT